MSLVILVLLGMVAASVVDVAAIIVAIVGLARRRRGVAFIALGLAAAAIVLNAFDWMVVLRGKDTRGEPITWRDDSELYVIAIAQACVLVLAICGALTRGRPAAELT